MRIARSNLAWPAIVLSVTMFTITATATGSDAILAAYPHDSAAFTQGLLYHDGDLFESTGRYGASTLRRVDLVSGRITHSVALADRYFGEGLALADGRLYQLTWKAGIVFVYDPDSLETVGHHRYTGEGWGLTWDGSQLIMSDGSAVLRRIDPDDFSVAGRIRVRNQGRPVDNLNELEYIDGEIWANVWHADRIVRIDPGSGKVTGVMDAAHLRSALPTDNNAGVLNGIAWDDRHRRLFVTGKNWPRLFQITGPPRDADDCD